MAIVMNNTLTAGLSGAIGTLVYRQLRGKTVVSKKPKSSGQSVLQKENRNKFKLAAAYAKEMMLDPQKKSYYWHKAKKLKLPNAYTAAITDYMRKGEISDINTRNYKGKAGDVIQLKIQKKDFGVKNVNVSILSSDGQVIERGVATRKERDVFIFMTKQTITERIPVVLRINADANDRMVPKEVELTW